MSPSPSSTPSAPARVRLHGFPLSGHSHRAELMLSLLGIDAEIVTVDLPGGAQRTPAFLALNPLGQVPVLEDGDAVVPDSSAILVYLARRYDPSGAWAPLDPVRAAETHRWLGLASGLLAYGPAAARLETVFGASIDRPRAEAAAKKLFGLMESVLKDRAFLQGSAPTIADVALYSYTARAPEGGVALDGWPAIRAWLARIEDLPGFTPMPQAADVLGAPAGGSAS